MVPGRPFWLSPTAGWAQGQTQQSHNSEGSPLWGTIGAEDSQSEGLGKGNLPQPLLANSRYLGFCISRNLILTDTLLLEMHPTQEHFKGSEKSCSL